MTNALAQWQLDLGANPASPFKTHFKVWAPRQKQLSIQIEGKKTYPLECDDAGYFSGFIEGVQEGDNYSYVLDNGTLRPDPVSRSLLKGLHSSTQIINPLSFNWTDSRWKGIPLNACIFYELHVGTFTQKGTFEGVIEKIPYLKELGITCIELMPVSEFPGHWNWGYDGASLYAVNQGYGGPNGLKQLVNACHEAGIAVCLDVVYNHLGPEGNYLADFGPYFSDIYRTPWGNALNYDGPYSPHVRDLIIKNALYWIVEYHIDVLRLDAIHGIYDFSACPMLKELREKVREVSNGVNREVHVIAESDLNESRTIRSKRESGWDFSAVWNDDYHHAVHVALTGEKNGYYCDFEGIKDIAKSLERGFVYDGKYSSFRKRKHGNSSEGISFEKFVVFIQNHDQIGNRPKGDRLASMISLKKQKLAALLNLMTPYLPLLFMGQEYGEKAPFEYFVDFEDSQLMNAIHQGRKQEFQNQSMPYPGIEAFKRSHLSWDLDQAESKELFHFYQSLIALRKHYPPKSHVHHVAFSEENAWLNWRYETQQNIQLGVLCNFSSHSQSIDLSELSLSLNITPKILLSTESQRAEQEFFFLSPEEGVLFLIQNL